MKRTLYPKTTRIGKTQRIVITEKLDGSNLGIFNVGGELIIAQRNNVYKRSELDKNNSYKGLIEWLDMYGDTLRDNLVDGSGLFGEWIGMGELKYGDMLDNIKFHMFAKANLNDNYEMHGLVYISDYFKYPFVDQVIPDFIRVVPEVAKSMVIPTTEDLDKLFDEYEEEVGRHVEGFIVVVGNDIKKYVRRKRGTLIPHRK